MSEHIYTIRLIKYNKSNKIHVCQDVGYFLDKDLVRKALMKSVKQIEDYLVNHPNEYIYNHENDLTELEYINGFQFHVINTSNLLGHEPTIDNDFIWQLFLMELDLNAVTLFDITYYKEEN